MPRLANPAVDRRGMVGPFDVVGDVHGCYAELLELLHRLGYRLEDAGSDINDGPRVVPPSGRTLVFLGDLVDRGPNTPDVLRLVMRAVGDGVALCVIGNHDDKLRRKLAGRPVKVAHGLAESLAQLSEQPAAFVNKVYFFLESLPYYYLLDGGRLVVAHAGLKEQLQGRVGSRVRDFALYGDTTGEVDDVGLPIRRNWASNYRGRATVVYGHTFVAVPEWVNNTIDIDTGCVFGGALTALRYPERELVSVPAKQVYWEPLRGPISMAVETTKAA